MNPQNAAFDPGCKMQQFLSTGFFFYKKEFLLVLGKLSSDGGCSFLGLYKTPCSSFILSRNRTSKHNNRFAELIQLALASNLIFPIPHSAQNLL